MKARTSYVLVGLFVLTLGVVLIAAILWLTTGGPPKDYDFYLVYMTESVTGLNLDAPVKYKGVNRGRVREIELDPNDPERVRVLLVVQKGTPINSATKATLEYQGLTGIASINLVGGSKDAQPLSVPLRMSHAGLVEALTDHLGSPSRASVKFQRQLQLRRSIADRS